MKCVRCSAELEAKAFICPKCGCLQENGQRLVLAAMDGDQDAVADLYGLTYETVYRAVKFIIKKQDDTLDIVQDSYIQAFQSLHQLKDPAKFQGWLKQIALHTAKNWLNKKKPLLFSELRSGDEDEEPSQDYEDDRMENLPDVVLDRKETSRLVNAIMDELPEDQRLAAVMFYYEGRSVREIANFVGCSENTIKSRLNYARKKIELQVNKLAKEGTKLYSVAPITLLRLLLRDAELQAAEQAAAYVPTSAAAAGAAEAGAHAAAGEGVHIAAKGGRHAAARAGSHAAGQAAAKAAGGVAAKAVGAKIAAGVAAVAILGGGAAVVTNMGGGRAAPEPTAVVGELLPETGAELTPEPSPEPTPDLSHEAYRQILDEYAADLAMDSSDYLNQAGAWTPDQGTESYRDTYTGAMWNYHQFGGMSFYYAFLDIDGSGTDELLIGSAADGYDIQPVDAYTFDGEKAVKAVYDPAVGDRSRLHIMSGGGLYSEGSSGYNSGSVGLRRIGADGFTVEDVFFYEYLIEDAGTRYYNDTESLSQEEFDQLMAGSQEITEFDWQPLYREG